MFIQQSNLIIKTSSMTNVINKL